MRNKLIVTFLLILSSKISFCQLKAIDTLKYTSRFELNQSNENTIFYPIFHLENDSISMILNQNFKEVYFSEYEKDKPVTELIEEAEGLAILDFEITYLDSNFISLNVFSEGCGAYCTSWRLYLIYSLKSGKRLFLNDFIDLNNDFIHKIENDYLVQYQENVQDITKLRNENEIDQETFEYIIENYSQSKESFKEKLFLLYPNKIQIVSKSELPHYIRCYDMFIELDYLFSDYKNLLKVGLGY